MEQSMSPRHDMQRAPHPVWDPSAVFTLSASLLALGLAIMLCAGSVMAGDHGSGAFAPAVSVCMVSLFNGIPANKRCRQTGVHGAGMAIAGVIVALLAFAVCIFRIIVVIQ